MPDPLSLEPGTNPSKWNQAEERLELIEQIAKYKEDKMRREYERLQGELEQEAEKERLSREKEAKRKKRMEQVKKQLEEY